MCREVNLGTQYETATAVKQFNLVNTPAGIESGVIFQYARYISIHFSRPV